MGAFMKKSAVASAVRMVMAYDGGADNSVLEQVKASLAKMTDEVRAVGEKAMHEAKTAGEVAKSTKEKVDELLTDQGVLKERLADLEKKSVRAGGDPDPVKDLRFYLGENKENLKAFQAQRQQNSTVMLKMPREVLIPNERGIDLVKLKALTNSGITGAALNFPGTQVMAQPLSPLTRRLTIRDLLAPGNMDGATLYYVRETGFTNNAAPVSEGSLKPKSELTFETVVEPARTIAHLLDISLQMLDDVSYIQSYVSGRLLYGLKLVEENQLLMGSGAGQNLEGIYTAATAYSQPAGTIVGGTAAETDIDKLRLALLQVELANAFANGIVIHPTSWANIELLKDTTGRYIFTDPTNETTPRLWGRDVVPTQAMTLGRFLVGDFAQHAQIFDRQEANLQISFENKDNFERNMATLRMEERLGLAIYRPEAFVKGTLESES